MAVHKYITGSSAVEIVASIEAAVRSGALGPNAALPTVRACSESLGVSPATVASAYRTLRGRGLVVTRGRLGTRVSAQPPLPTPPSFLVPEGVRDLSHGNPDLALLPQLDAALAAIDPAQRLYGEELKLPELLVELVRGQFEADGIEAEHLTVVSGALDGLERVMAAHLRPGDAVAVEDPAFSSVLALLQPLGFVPRPVAIDSYGFLPDAFEAALLGGVRAVVLTPRAQNPTGAALDAKRARTLRRVLRNFEEVLVIEDDHAGPVAGVPAETLCTGRRHWAIARSHSKALGPDLRVATLVGDEETISRVEGRQLIGMRWVSHILQQLVLALLRQRGIEARLRKAATTYTRRREALIRELAGHGIEATGRSGLNVWIPVHEEAGVVGGLLEAGYAVAPGERFRLEAGPAIRVTTASLEPADAAVFADALARVLGPSTNTFTT